MYIKETIIRDDLIDGFAIQVFFLIYVWLHWIFIAVLPLHFCLSLIFIQRRQWHPIPVLLPEKSHGWRSLEGCSPWGREESDTTERLPFHFSLSCIREGNGNPLQRSCLENPRDRGIWWASVYGVAQSRTRLKQLSSSSSSKHSRIHRYVHRYMYILCTYTIPHRTVRL